MLMFKRKPKRRPKKKKTLMGRLFSFFRLMVILLLLPVVIGVAGGGFWAFLRTVPSIEEMKQHRTPPSTKIYADDDTLVGELKLRKGIYVALDKMPRDLLDAVVAVEDSNFWEHKGIDYTAILRAAIKDVMERHLKEGGSTITQQLVKITFLTPEKTIKRKLKEAILATRIERNLSKKEILELYLNRVYFGHGAYGVEMAAKVYFGKTIAEITLPEAALLVGLLKAPNTYSPFKGFDRAKRRQRLVLGRMENEGFISRKQKYEAVNAPVYLNRTRTGSETNSYFVDYVRRYLIERYGADTVYKGGMKVYTTLNRQAQKAAQAAIKRGIRNLDKRRGFRGPIEHREIDVKAEFELKGSFRSIPPNVGAILPGMVLEVTGGTATIKASGLIGTLLKDDAAWARYSHDEESGQRVKMRIFSMDKILAPGDVVMVKVKSVQDDGASFQLEQTPEAQGAVVALEPMTGFIRVLVGGFDPMDSEFNRAILAERQPGSAFKPIVFALALTQGFTPASVVMDSLTHYRKTLDGPKPNRDPNYNPLDDPDYNPEDFWIPMNYDGEFHGPTRLRVALVKSRNVVTVKLVDRLGVARVAAFARKFGITKNLPSDLTIGLGSVSVTPLDMTAAYGVIANKGMKMKPIGIKYIIDRRGSVILSNEPSGERVIDEPTAFLMTDILADVVRRGTGWRAKALRRPTAGKTGTTNEYRDAWFLGFTRDMIAGVWVGFDDMRSLGEQETGSRAAAPIWVDFMKAISINYEPKDFEVPKGITTRMIDPLTGLLANKWTEEPIKEFFKEGTEPEQVAPSIWQTNEPENLLFR